MLKLNQLKIAPYLTVGDHFRFLEAKTAYVYEKGEVTSKVKGYRCKLQWSIGAMTLFMSPCRPRPKSLSILPFA